MTPQQKEHIDHLTYYELLEHWRFAPAGDPWFRGDVGDYWTKRMAELKPANAAQISKDIGWGDKHA